MYAKVHINEILVTQNPQLIMTPMLHLKNEIEPDHIPVTFVNISDDLVQLTKHVPVGSLQLYTEYQDKWNTFDIEINHFIKEKENDNYLKTNKMQNLCVLLQK